MLSFVGRSVQSCIGEIICFVRVDLLLLTISPGLGSAKLVLTSCLLFWALVTLISVQGVLAGWVTKIINPQRLRRGLCMSCLKRACYSAY